MVKHKEQRVGVLVDTSNLYHSARNLYKKRINYRHILKQAVAGRKLIRATAYVITNEANKNQANFFSSLSQVGFEVKDKPLQTFYGGAKKGDWDVGITIDALKLAPKLDVIVLVSGDGDYLPAVSYLQNNMGCLVEVMAFRPTTSNKLIEAADDYTDLSSDPEYLILD